MIDHDQRYREYYMTNEYRGFRKVREQNYKFSFSTHLTFSDGNREVFASGSFKEEALKKIFNRIDSLHASNEIELACEMG